MMEALTLTSQTNELSVPVFPQLALQGTTTPETQEASKDLTMKTTHMEAHTMESQSVVTLLVRIGRYFQMKEI